MLRAGRIAVERQRSVPENSVEKDQSPAITPTEAGRRHAITTPRRGGDLHLGLPADGVPLALSLDPLF
jgi:hypothetical protein